MNHFKYHSCNQCHCHHISSIDLDKYQDKLPKLQFDPDWQIEFRPPTMGAMVRFKAIKGDVWVSVYLDCFGTLGSFWNDKDEQCEYWEIYPSADDGEPERFEMNDTKGLIEGISKALQWQLDYKESEND